MSHFTAAVIIKDINNLEAALAPFQENNMGDCPKEYMTFTSVYEQCKKEYEEEDEETKTKYNTLKSYIEDYKGYNYDEEQKQYGYWENPNAKWDYWTLCEANSWARFKNKNMPKGYCKVKDFIMAPDPAHYEYAIREWELIVEEKPLKDGEEKPFNLYKPQYYIDTYKTKEKYAEIIATPHTWAFVLNGKWCEKGNMGWWGMNDANNESIEAYLKAFKEIITNVDYQDYYIAVVDCHI